MKKILPAGSDLVSTHRSKEMVLVFNKDTGEALNIACNTQSDKLQLSKATQITVLMLKVFQGKIKKRKKSRWISATNFKNINKFHTDWAICDSNKKIRSQSIIIKQGCTVNFATDCPHSTKSPKESSHQRIKRDKHPFLFLWAQKPTLKPVRLR